MNPEVKTKDAVLIQFHNFKVWYDTEKTEDKCFLNLFEVEKAMDEWADIKVTAALSERPGADWIDIKDRKPDIVWDDCNSFLIYGCKFGNLEEDLAGYQMIANYNPEKNRFEDDLGNDINDNKDYWWITHWRAKYPDPTTSLESTPQPTEGEHPDKELIDFACAVSMDTVAHIAEREQEGEKEVALREFANWMDNLPYFMAHGQCKVNGTGMLQEYKSSLEKEEKP